MRLASISIDLDGLKHYEALYGLTSQSSSDAVARLAPGRLAGLLEERNAKGTFFAIAREILDKGGPLRALAEAGHEIGNHTLTHPYGATRLSSDALRAEVEGGAEAIAKAVGVRPTGFRAPGYTLTSALLDVAFATGHAYDSSVFPAAPYYLAKALVMSFLRLAGRPSAAILDRPRVLLAPLVPYRPARDEPYARGNHEILELPIAVDPILRIPFFGTLVVSFPWPLVRLVYASVRRLPFLNLELHGVDLLEPADGISPELARAQRDLRLPLAAKLARLRTLLSWIARDYEIVTLRVAAERLGKGLP
jgi:peptidoglycan-N-acetylglucosamine deacetylase